jgi:hypothetical protein
MHRQYSYRNSPLAHTPSPERSQDVAYKHALETQAAAEPPLTDHTNAEQRQLTNLLAR